MHTTSPQASPQRQRGSARQMAHLGNLKPGENQASTGSILVHSRLRLSYIWLPFEQEFRNLRTQFMKSILKTEGHSPLFRQRKKRKENLSKCATSVLQIKQSKCLSSSCNCKGSLTRIQKEHLRKTGLYRQQKLDFSK